MSHHSSKQNKGEPYEMGVPTSPKDHLREISRLVYSNLPEQVSGMGNETTQYTGGMGEGNENPQQQQQQVKNMEEENFESLNDEDIDLHLK